MKNLIPPLKTIILGLILALGISYAFAWTAPTLTPPLGNVLAPVNVGLDTQTKGGFLWADGGLGSMSGGAYFGGGIKISDTTATYPGTIKFSGGDFWGYTGTEWKSLTAGSAPATPPVVNISVSTSPIATAQSTTLTWSTTDAVSCSASGGWSGSKATSGSQSVSPAVTTNYTLSCLSSQGLSGANSVNVDVKQWQATVGRGNLGETCDAWLARTGQAGINGSAPRGVDVNSGMTYAGYCFYHSSASRNNPMASSWSHLIYYPGECNNYPGCENWVDTETRR